MLGLMFESYEHDKLISKKKKRFQMKNMMVVKGLVKFHNGDFLSCEYFPQYYSKRVFWCLLLNIERKPLFSGQY